VSRYRHFGRIPTVVWRCRKNGAVLVRSSQPSVGLLGRRSAFDERFLGAILESCIYDDLDDDEFFEINVCNQEHSFDKNGKTKDDAICSHNYCDNCINHCMSERRKNQAAIDGNHHQSEPAHHSKSNGAQFLDTSGSEDNETVLTNQSLVNSIVSESLNQLTIESLQLKGSSEKSEDFNEQSEAQTETNEDDSDDSSKPNFESNHSCRCDCHQADPLNRSESSLISSQISERNKDKRLLILDARSFTVAFFNRAMGGGSECAEYYPNCDVDYLYLANIHAVRNAFLSIRSLCENNTAQTPN
jgi:hypothetical protein